VTNVEMVHGQMVIEKRRDQNRKEDKNYKIGAQD
jgi:hypothetical protein